MKNRFVVLVLLCFSVSLAQGKAFQTIHFGDSLETVAEKLMALDGVYSDFKLTTQDTRDPINIIKYAYLQAEIGGVKYILDFRFFDNKLFRIEFSSPPLTADFLDTQVRDYMGTLYQVISRSQGSPNSSTNVGLFDIENGYITWAHKWDTNTEGTSYKIGLSEIDSRFAADLWIEWTWLADLYKQNISDDQDSAIDESASDF